MDPLVWSALLLVLGLTLVMAEVFIPSGGILGFLAILSLLTSVILAFYHQGVEAGFGFLGIIALAVPIVLTVAFRYWPHTPMGRRLLLDLPKGEEMLPDSPERRSLRQLVGKFGVAKSVMLPSGAVQIDGQVYDALSEGVPIEAGQRIRVIEVRGARVLVRATDERTPETANDVLSQPIESLGLDSLEDPLA